MSDEQSAVSSDRAMLEIEQLLRHTMGMTTESIGSAAIHRSVHERMAVSHIADIKAYHQLVHGGGEELQELIEQVVVPETSFFRHPQSFAALTSIVKAPGGFALGNLPLLVLSAPCSTGEEAYSIAITLLECGLWRDQIHVEALDISHRVLVRAERAIYGENSFRGDDTSFRDRYFRRIESGYALADSIRGLVRFRQENLLHVTPSPGTPKYHVIFCRNLLIYLDRPTQEQVMGLLRQMLVPGGYLFVGPAEATLASECGFHTAGYPMAFAYRNAGPGERKIAAQAKSSIRRSPPAPRVARVPIAMGPTSQPESLPAGDFDTTITKIRALADAGSLNEAARLCEPLLQTHSASAEVHYLLGLIYDAQGDVVRAADAYRRALFLAPRHPDATEHLALLARSQGDTTRANRLHARARRIEREGELNGPGESRMRP